MEEALNRLPLLHPQHAAGGVAYLGANAVGVAFGGDEFTGQLQRVLAVGVGQGLFPLNAAAWGLLFGVVDEVERQRLCVAGAHAGAWGGHGGGDGASRLARLAHGDEDGGVHACPLKRLVARQSLPSAVRLAHGAGGNRCVGRGCGGGYVLHLHVRWPDDFGRRFALAGNAAARLTRLHEGGRGSELGAGGFGRAFGLGLWLIGHVVGLETIKPAGCGLGKG